MTRIVVVPITDECVERIHVLGETEQYVEDEFTDQREWVDCWDAVFDVPDDNQLARDLRFILSCAHSIDGGSREFYAMLDEADANVRETFHLGQDEDPSDETEGEGAMHEGNAPDLF